MTLTLTLTRSGVAQSSVVTAMSFVSSQNVCYSGMLQGETTAYSDPVVLSGPSDQVHVTNP